MKNIIFALLTFIFFFDVALAETNKKITTEDIPGPAKCYFDAVANTNLNSFSECFQAGAVIIDVNRKIVGIRAIRKWAEDEVFGGRYEILEIVSQKKGFIKLLIKFIPSGLWGKLSNGFKAHYTFEFSNGKIIKMDLQYA